MNSPHRSVWSKEAKALGPNEHMLQYTYHMVHFSGAGCVTVTCHWPHCYVQKLNLYKNHSNDHIPEQISDLWNLLQQHTMDRCSYDDSRATCPSSIPLKWYCITSVNTTHFKKVQALQGHVHETDHLHRTYYTWEVSVKQQLRAAHNNWWDQKEVECQSQLMSLNIGWMDQCLFALCWGAAMDSSGPEQHRPPSWEETEPEWTHEWTSAR